jgi:hypothetical protein
MPLRQTYRDLQTGGYRYKVADPGKCRVKTDLSLGAFTVALLLMRLDLPDLYFLYGSRPQIETAIAHPNRYTKHSAKDFVR